MKFSVAAVSVLTVAVACTKPTLQTPAPRQAQAGPWVVPLLNPLTANVARAQLRVENANGQQWISNVVLDSGAFHSVVSPKAVHALGTPTQASDTLEVIDSSGRARPWRHTTFEQATLGDLELSEFVAGVFDHELVGQEILGHYPVEFDFDRGIAIINGPVWRDVDSAVLLERDHTTPTTVVAINGHPVSMNLDTGASHSVLSADSAKRLGLKPLYLPVPRQYDTLHGQIETDYDLRAKRISLGGATLRQHVLTPGESLPEDLLGVGVEGFLGMDVLRQFRLRFDPVRQVLDLKQREGLLGTRGSRVARWAWVPQCTNTPGCLRAYHRMGDSVEIAVTTTKSYDRPVSILVGFAQRNKVARNLPLMTVHAPHLRVGSPTVVTLPLSAEARAELWPLLKKSDAAHQLVVLDVNPSQEKHASLVVDEPLAGYSMPRNSMRLATGLGVSGRAYEVFRGTDLQRCIAACVTDQSCRAFTYQKEEAGCFLQGRRGRRIAMRTAISGTKR